MSHKHPLRIAPQDTATAPETLALALDQDALDRARTRLEDGPLHAELWPWREQIVKLLNDSLATELVCILRYKRHHYTPPPASPRRRWPRNS